MTTNQTLPSKPPMNGFRNPFTGLTHIMTEEDRTAQTEFVREFVGDLDPRGAAELHFARTVALDSWRINRIKAVEENVFAYGQVLPGKHFTNEVPQVENAIGHAHTYMLYAKVLDKISLYESRLTRNIERNMELLMKLQARRAERRRNSQVIPIAEAHPQTASSAANCGIGVSACSWDRRSQAGTGTGFDLYPHESASQTPPRTALASNCKMEL